MSGDGGGGHSGLEWAGDRGAFSPSPPHDRPRAPGPGDPLQVGPFRIVAVLADTGPTRICVARTDRGRHLTVKAVRTEFAGTEGLRPRLAAAFQSAHAVRHPGLAEWVDAHAYDDPPWVAHNHRPGIGLAQALDLAGPLRDSVLWNLAAGLGTTLAAVHDAGIAHHAITPGNVLLTAGGPRLLDLGCSVSTLLAGPGTARAAGFTAPEVLRGEPAGPPADVFALGAVLVLAATGRGPFGSGDPIGVAVRAVHEAPDLEGVPGALRTLATRCLRKDPADRPAMAALVAGLPAPDTRYGSWLPTPLLTEILRRAEYVLGMEAPMPARGKPGGRPVLRTPPQEAAGHPRPAGTGKPAGTRKPAWTGEPAPTPRAETADGTARTSRSSRTETSPSADDTSSPLDDDASKSATSAAPLAERARPADRAGAGAPPGTRVRRFSRRQAFALGGAAVAGAVAGGAVLARRLLAADRPRWRYDAGASIHSPVFADARSSVVLVADMDLSLHAVDARTGTRLWRPRRAKRSMSRWFDFDGAGNVVLCIDEKLTALRTRDGVRLWFATGTGRGDVVTDRTAAYVTATERDGRHAGQLLAVDLATRAVRWRWSGPGTFSEGATRYGGALLFCNDSAVYCLEAATGKVRWRRPLQDSAGAPPVGAGGLAWLNTSNGDLFGLDLRTGDPRVTALTSGEGYSPGYTRVAVSGEVAVACTTDFDVFAVHTRTGKILWSKRTRADKDASDGIGTTPLIHRSTVYTGSGGPEFLALDLRTGREKWRFRTSRPIDSSPVLLNGLVYFGCYDHGLYAVDPLRGPR
ncbi:PQQ-binding-like beta-propeller repeat protein [Streptomyces sp. NPDC051018]|uniref:outer membrane protein assembly factor BamB family protein n=1 Tax=Streptomyces sp. NPDC051018 TaxID=3365639 RepID=UPI0037A35DFF